MGSSPVIIFTTTTIIAVVLTAALISQYQRETTSVEDKYTNRSSAEIDATYHQSYLDPNLITEDSFYDDNIIGSSEVAGSPIATQASSNPNDFDEDGLPNATDPDPRNPDTDGDGLIDGQDPAPTDPVIGQTAPPPAPPIDQTKPAGELEIHNFYTNVRDLNRGQIQWSSYTEAKPGDRLAFIVYAELINTSSNIDYEATIVDQLQLARLKYDNSSATIEINGGQPQTLAGNGWMNGYTVKVPAGQTKIVEIRFNAIATLNTPDQIIVATNFAFVTTTSDNKKTDTAFVTIDSYPLTK